MTRRAAKRSPLFVDASIIMYAAGAPHPLKEPGIAVLDAVASGAVAAKTSVEVVQEILHRFTHIKRRQPGLELARQTLDLFQPLLPVRPRDMRLAIELLEKYPTLSSRDALHAAVALDNGIRRIVSAYRDFEVIREIELVTPEDLVYR